MTLSSSSSSSSNSSSSQSHVSNSQVVPSPTTSSSSSRKSLRERKYQTVALRAKADFEYQMQLAMDHHNRLPSTSKLREDYLLGGNGSKHGHGVSSSGGGLDGMTSASANAAAVGISNTYPYDGEEERGGGEDNKKEEYYSNHCHHLKGKVHSNAAKKLSFSFVFQLLTRFHPRRMYHYLEVMKMKYHSLYIAHSNVNDKNSATVIAGNAARCSFAYALSILVMGILFVLQISAVYVYLQNDPRKVLQQKYFYDKNISLLRNNDVSGSAIDAVVTLATGSYSAFRLVYGLRNVGNFRGKIYVISDHEDNDDIVALGATPININDDKLQLRPVFQSEEDRLSWENTKLAKVKWYKTQIFHITPQNDNINTILFMDADVIINNPMKSFEMLTTEYIKEKESSDCAAYYFQERFYAPDSVNSGTAFFFRDKSRLLLEKWSKELLSGKHIRDQIALDFTLRNNDIHVCSFPSYMNYYTTDFFTNTINFFTFGIRRQTATFIHPTANKNLRAMAGDD